MSNETAELQPVAYAEAASMVNTAARLLADISTGEQPECRLDSVSWRLADALQLLGKTTDNLPGVHEPTGRGAQLKP